MAEGLEADISWRHERALKLKGTRWNKVIGSNHHPMTPIAWATCAAPLSMTR
jgi:hypothetical protein